MLRIAHFKLILPNIVCITMGLICRLTAPKNQLVSQKNAIGFFENEGGESSAVWNFSENSSVLVWPFVPYLLRIWTITKVMMKCHKLTNFIGTSQYESKWYTYIRMDQIYIILSIHISYLYIVYWYTGTLFRPLKSTLKST